MEEVREETEITHVHVDLTADAGVAAGESMTGVGSVHAAVLGFGRALLQDGHASLAPAVEELRAAVNADGIVVELFAEDGDSTVFVAGSHDLGDEDHWVPVTVDGAWAGTVSMVLGRSIGPTEQWMLEAVADLFEGWVRRRRVEEALRRTIEEKDRFVATVSHEIRTPLSAVLGLAQELRDRSEMMESTEVRELLGIVAEQAREITDIVEDLLVLARAGRSTITVAPERVRLDDIAREAVASVPTQARSGLVMRNVEQVEAVCDPLRTRQIVRNLIVNAHRHGGPHTYVDVVSTPGGDAILRIADNGGPIPEERRESMFEAYSGSDRADGPLSSVGLGLTVCRQLARAMDGELFYHWDGESRFDVHLPRPA